MSEGLRVRDVGTGSRVTTPVTQGGCKAQCWISCARPQAMQLTEFYLCCCCSCAQPGLLRQLWCLGPKSKSGLGKEEAVIWQLSSLGEPEPAERGTTLPSCSSAPDLVSEESFTDLQAIFFLLLFFFLQTTAILWFTNGFVFPLICWHYSSIAPLSKNVWNPLLGTCCIRKKADFSYFSSCFMSMTLVSFSFSRQYCYNTKSQNISSELF